MFDPSAVRLPATCQSRALHHLAAVLQLLPGGAYLCADDGRLTFYTARAAQLWGWLPPLEDPTQVYCGALRLYTAAGAPLAHAQCWMARALQERVPHENRHVVIERPDGSRVAARVHASPVIDEHGQLLGGVSLMFELTPQEALQQRQRDEHLLALACDLRAGLDPLRRSAQRLGSLPDTSEARATAGVLDQQLRQLTRLADELLNLDVEVDWATPR